MSNALFPRFLVSRIFESLQDTQVTAIVGPRQSGKTTLAKNMTSGKRAFYDLDDSDTHHDAISNPKGFIRKIEYGTIDEIQNAPQLIRAIKLSVDSDPRPGRFLLTGSADIMTIPTISKSLTGRMSVHCLLPLSQAEIEGNQVCLLDHLFEENCAPPKMITPKIDDMMERALLGGYPSMRRMESEASRRNWAANYMNSLIIRSVQEQLDAQWIPDLSILLGIISFYSGQLADLDKMASAIGVDKKTLNGYMRLLEQMYLFERLPAWSGNTLMQVTRRPKLHFLDAGLLAVARELDLPSVKNDHGKFGSLLESFVFSELRKMAAWSKRPFRFYHYRDKSQFEVDLVISSGSGALAGIEVKTTSKVSSGDFAGLRKFQKTTGSSFKFGMLLYGGNEIQTFGDRLFAAPVSILWT